MAPIAESQLRWILSGLIALGIMVAISLLFWKPSDFRPVAVAPAEKKPVGQVKLVNLGKNEAALTDPTVLFLPTEWNAGQNALPESADQQPGTAFAGYAAKLKFAESELALTFPADVQVPSGAAEALESGKPGQIFLGLGGGERPVTQLTPRKAFVEVSLAEDGQRVLAQALADANPPSGTAWQPMEFLVAVDAMGLVGSPVVTESSRVSAVDGYFQTYLAKTLRIGERLAPGFYRICVGP
ncbi:MAG: hypothetical protein JWM32_1166 [Verrucomicrobia bacterium]|nr:hypothetical protein [Verrucomicrobiota bacterium]